ncbi:MAG: motility associated factor glycosyltransferase family protein, partial [Spirochaetia bacterium]
MMYFEVNTKNLSGLFPRFEEEVLSPYSPAEGVQIHPSKSGAPTCLVNGKLLHSRHDPVREAERIIERNYAPEADCIVLLGFGLGYYAEACLERYPDAHIIIVEPDVPLFLTSLDARDYSTLWRSARVTLLLDAAPGGVSTALNALKARTCQVIALRGVYDAHAEYFARVQDAVKAHVSRRRINTNTLKRFGKLWVRNLSRNLASISRARDVRAFADRFAGLPALLLAGGPSLTGIIPNLPELKKRFVGVAVDTTLRACETAGVRPDVLIIVDPQYWNTRHLDGTSLEDLSLVSESSTHPRIFRLCGEAGGSGAPVTGPLYLCRSLFPLGRYVDSYTGIAGKLGAGGSV